MSIFTTSPNDGDIVSDTNGNSWTYRASSNKWVNSGGGGSGQYIYPTNITPPITGITADGNVNLLTSIVPADTSVTFGSISSGGFGSDTVTQAAVIGNITGTGSVSITTTVSHTGDGGSTRARARLRINGVQVTTDTFASATLDSGSDTDTKTTSVDFAAGDTIEFEHIQDLGRSGSTSSSTLSFTGSDGFVAGRIPLIAKSTQQTLDQNAYNEATQS